MLTFFCVRFRLLWMYQVCQACQRVTCTPVFLKKLKPLLLSRGPQLPVPHLRPTDSHLYHRVMVRQACKQRLVIWGFSCEANRKLNQLGWFKCHMDMCGNSVISSSLSQKLQITVLFFTWVRVKLLNGHFS